MSTLLEKLSIWQKDVIILAILNVCILSHIIGLSDIAGIVFLAVFPGILIMRLLSFKPVEVWERIIHVVGLSIIFVMFAGLAVNTVLPIINISRPLAQWPILISFDVLLMVIIAVNVYLKREDQIFFGNEGIKERSLIVYIWPVILPLLAVIGATILNNNGSSIIVGATVCVITASLFYLIIRFETVHTSVVITWLYWAALALLFTMSMRSWHVIGFDINHELQVFRITHDALYWSMGHMQDAYNACLSITLLPTIFSIFTHVSDEYMYKFVFQFIFALLPISLFYFLRIFFSARIAFVSIIMLIGQVVYSHGMPALVRQEFGFLYFGLTLLALFSNNLKPLTRYTLACMYAVGMIVSHYSTTYIAILMLAIMFTLNIALYMAKCLFPKQLHGNVSHKVSIFFIGFVVVTTMVWSSVITTTSGNIVGFFDRSSSNISEVFSYASVTRATTQLFTPYPHYENFEEYTNVEALHFRAIHPDLNFYDPKIASTTSLRRMSFTQSPGFFGETIKIITAHIFQVLKLSLNNLFIIIGMFILMYYWYRSTFDSSEFIFLASSGFVVIALLLFIPDAMNQYNIDRLYFQLLMIWAPLSVTTGLVLLSKIPTRIRFAILGTLYCTLMLFYNSLMFSIFGGNTLVSMGNFGSDYEKFYVHEGEIQGARWLSANHGHTPIFSNTPGFNRLLAYGNVHPNQIFTSLLPTMIDKDSYVFLTHINTVAGMSTYLFYNEEYSYTAPIEFLNKNKDLIYTTGVAQVFR
jgi:uncharacterized membrane protein